MGVVERDAEGKPILWHMVSSYMDELAKELDIGPMSVTQALRRSKRMVTRAHGGRIRNLHDKRCPLGRVRYYSVRG